MVSDKKIFQCFSLYKQMQICDPRGGAILALGV